MREMNIDKLARINVHMVIVNQSEPFYVTSTGQMFPFDRLEDAIAFEYQWLNSEYKESEESK